MHFLEVMPQKRIFCVVIEALFLKSLSSFGVWNNNKTEGLNYF